jgi:hypothetical protein
MNKNTMSRRGFLKGMVKTATAAVLANVIKFVPEAQEVLAQSGGLKDVTISPLSAGRVDTLVSQAVNGADGQTLRRFLDTRGFVEMPGMRVGSRVQVRTKEGVGKVDILIVGYTSPTEQRGAIFGYGAGSAGQQYNIPMAVISKEAVYIVQSGQVAISVNSPKGLVEAPLTFRSNLSGQALAAQGACCSLEAQCIILGVACTAATVCCLIGGVPCCGTAVATCAAAGTACLLASNCCATHPPEDCNNC